MPQCCSWLSRLCCCRRQSSQAYIYLYSPTMVESSSSSSSSSPSSSPCLVCVLFGLCLAFIVILAAVFIYHLNSHDLVPTPVSTVHPRVSFTSKKRQLPDFVNTNIDPCEHFYDFVCDKITRKKRTEQLSYNDDDVYDDDDDEKDKSRRIRYHLHDQLMNNQSYSRRTNENDSTSSIYRFYQLCENQSPSLLLDELERYFAKLSQEEPYRSYLTLFNRTVPSPPLILNVSMLSQIFEPFFQFESISSDSIRFIRTHHRPLPSPLLIFPNLTILNQTALKQLTQFDDDLMKLLTDQKNLSQSYKTKYNSNAFILRRIVNFSDSNSCLPSESNRTSGLGKIIELFHYFLRSRLAHLNTKSIDKQIRILEKLNNQQSLVEHLQRITTELRTIDQITPSTKEKNMSCIFDILDQLLDSRVQFDELPSIIRNSFENDTFKYFLSDDWPYLILLHDRLIETNTFETLVNYAFFDSYRHLIYPYYQPHVDRSNEIHLDHRRSTRGYTYHGSYPNSSCIIHSCWDIIHCYHPSLLNRVITPLPQTDLKNIRNFIENLIEKFRHLIEQSDHLYGQEKKSLIEHLNKIQVIIGHYPSETLSTSDLFSSSISESSFYFDYVRYLSKLPYDQTDASSFIEPIYFPSNHSLYLPYGFLFVSNESLNYHLIKFLLKIVREYLSSEPFRIECFLRSSLSSSSSMDDDEKEANEPKLTSNDEELTYIYSRSKFLIEKKILLDEYLWPFMNANIDMKRFLIDYTAKNFCATRHGLHRWMSNNYILDDVYLIFHCPNATLIKQSKCTIV